LLPLNKDSLPLLQGLEKLQESLISNSDPQNVESQNKINDDHWLTAEDIINAADDPDSKYTHSPIVLIPFDDAQPAPNLDLEKLPSEIFKNPFTILDTLSPTANSIINPSGDDEITDDREITGQSSQEVPRFTPRHQ